MTISPLRWRVCLAAAILGVLAACTTTPRDGPAPVEDRGSGTAPGSPAAAAPGASSPVAAGTTPILRARGRWVPATWADMPGWDADRSAEMWPALLRGCERPAPGWSTLCADALLNTPTDDASARSWLQTRLQPYRIESTEGNADGMITGYYEPLVEASRLPQGAFRVALHKPPPDLVSRKPYWTRQQLDTLPAAQAALRGRELAYVADPLDLLILQIQGSGRLLITEPDGSRKLVRVAYAGHNDLPYKSVGRWLVEQGELRLDQVSWPGIKAWARRNPGRVNEMLWANPRVVFFRDEPLSDPTQGPRGAQGVALTAGRSIAVDPQSIPYGSPVWLDTTEPLASTPLRRLVMAQDTGTAITGAVRADYFWGWGEAAEQQAGRMKQALRMWVLWPAVSPPAAARAP